MTNASEQFMGVDVEWAAECLYDQVEQAKSGDPRVPPTQTWAECPVWFKPLQRKMARHAITHGYRPPPRPVPVREQLARFIQEGFEDPNGVFGVLRGGTYRQVADRFLARFNVTPK